MVGGEADAPVPPRADRCSRSGSPGPTGGCPRAGRRTSARPPGCPSRRGLPARARSRARGRVRVAPRPEGVGPEAGAGPDLLGPGRRLAHQPVDVVPPPRGPVREGAAAGRTWGITVSSRARTAASRWATSSARRSAAPGPGRKGRSRLVTVASHTPRVSPPGAARRPGAGVPAAPWPVRPASPPRTPCVTLAPSCPRGTPPDRPVTVRPAPGMPHPGDRSSILRSNVHERSRHRDPADLPQP